MQEEVDLLRESPAPVSAASISLPLGLIAISGGRGTRRDVQFSRALLRWAEAGSERLLGGSISAVKVQREITFIPCFLPYPQGPASTGTVPQTGGLDVTLRMSPHAWSSNKLAQ